MSATHWRVSPSCRLATPGLILLAFLAVGAPAAHAQTDLSVAWIGRFPKIPYVWGSRRPHVVGWPKPGQPVTWAAHVRNLGDGPLDQVPYRWLLDGQVVTEGTVTLPPRSVVRVDLQRPWRRVRQELVFEIDPDGQVAEEEERNNSLLVHTDALGVGLWVEQGFWDAIRPTLVAAEIGATTFEDWMQIRIRQFNEMAALARYPDTPHGVLDRWRIDAIHLVPDRALPVSPVGPEVRDWAPPSAYPHLYPDSKDRTIDIEWGFPASHAPFYTDREVWTLLNDSFLHELGHARYLVDVFAWDLFTPRDEIGIAPAPPGGWVHATPEHGLMNTSWGFIDRYSAMALNRIAGRRATHGHYNEPSNIGVFLNDLPARNRLRLVTPEGRVFPHRRVEIFRPSGARDPDWLEHPYRRSIDGKPDLVMKADAQGTVLLGRNPFSQGRLEMAVDLNNALAIVRVIDGSTSHWGYLEARQLNLAYWRGQRKLATHDVVLDERRCPGFGLGPNDVTPSHWALVGGPQVTFSWGMDPAVDVGLWLSVDGGEPRRVAVPQGASAIAQTVEGRHVAWWLEYARVEDDPACPRRRSTTYFFDVDTR